MLNDDIIDEIDNLISKIKIPVIFTYEFVHLYFLVRKIYLQNIDFQIDDNFSRLINLK